MPRVPISADPPLAALADELADWDPLDRSSSSKEAEASPRGSRTPEHQTGPETMSVALLQTTTSEPQTDQP